MRHFAPSDSPICPSGTLPPVGTLNLIFFIPSDALPVLRLPSHNQREAHVTPRALGVASGADRRLSIRGDISGVES